MLRPAALLVGLLLGLHGSGPASAGDALRVLESRHYAIRTDLDAPLAEDFAGRMDAMYDEYARRLAGFAAPDDARKLQAYLFATRADYVRFTKDRFPNTGGVFIPSRNLLAAFLEGQGRDGLRRTLQHEAFHQFAFASISKDLPIWLNEGLAQVFEEGIWTGRQFLIGQVPPRRVRQLHADLDAGRLIDFSRLLDMSDRQWAENLSDRTQGALQYNQAWAMAHFLIYAADAEGRPRFRARLLEMLRLIHEGAPGEKAFRAAFSDNIAGFQDRFVAWAREMKPTREATYIEHQQVLADLLVMLRERGQTFATIEDFRRHIEAGGFRLQYTKGQLQWTTDQRPRTYFSDMDGRLLTPHRLFFELRRGATLPDLVCRPHEGLQYRTRFHQEGQRLEFDVQVQHPPQ